MAKGINISIASETREFQSGVKRGVIEPLEDAVEVLAEVGKAGDDAGGKLEDAMRDAQRDTDGLSDEMRTLKDRIDDAARKGKDLGDSGRDAGRKYEDGMDRAKRGVDDFKDEANSTAREAAASFDGSAESIGDAFQEVAANALGGFGPAGAVAGLAAAAGIGLAMAGFEDVAQKQEESEARIDEWAAAYIEAGGRALDSLTTFGAAQAILTDTARYTEAVRNAELWGVSVETAVAAMVGSHSALAEAQAGVTAAAEAEAAAMADIPYDETTVAALDMNSAARQGQDALNGITGEMQSAGERASIMSQLMIDHARATAGATSSVDEFGDEVISLPDGAQVYIDAQTGQATNNVDAIERRIYGIPDSRTSRVNVIVNDDSVDAFLNRDLNRYATVTTIVRPGQTVAW